MGHGNGFRPVIGLALSTFVATTLTLTLPVRADGPAVGRPKAKGSDLVATPETAVAEGNNRFAFDLYARLRGGPGNLFFSPYSIASALAMTAAGARGETERQVANALHVSVKQADRDAGFKALIDRLNNAGDAPAARVDTLVSANALWLQKGEPFLPAFLDAATQKYSASAFDVDFADNPEAARKAINTWVENQTADKIKNLVGPADVTPTTALVLTNAVYFKGAWLHPFSPGATDKEGVFTNRDGKKATTALMIQSESYRHFDGGTFQVLELPYTGNRRALLVVLPKALDGLSALEPALTPEVLDGWSQGLKTRRVNLQLPKFRVEEAFQLSDTLKALGIVDAFDASRADFSGMTGSRDRAISAVIHKAFVDVNESGTEAAAASAVVMMRTSAIRPEPPVDFKADHPFLFLIRDQATGAVLFLGRVETL